MLIEKTWFWVALAGVAGYAFGKASTACAEAMADDEEDGQEALPDTPVIHEIQNLNRLWLPEEEESPSITQEALPKMRARYEAALKTILEQHGVVSKAQGEIVEEAWTRANNDHETKETAILWESYLNEVVLGVAETNAEDDA